jgi:hypothetical protein
MSTFDDFRNRFKVLKGNFSGVPDYFNNVYGGKAQQHYAF